MKILLIGYKEELELVYQSIRSKTYIRDVIEWSNQSGPERVEALIKKNYDAIVLAFKDRKMETAMKKILSEIYKVEMEKILAFYWMCQATVPFMLVDRVLKNPLEKKYEGLILGISHAQCGILSNQMKKKFANLAVSSQDIFYNWKTLEYCMEKYRDKVKDLKYIVFDMYDYNYFNFDISRSRQAISYYKDGGFCADAHNFMMNKFYNSNTFEDIIMYLQSMKYEGILGTQVELWEKLFENVHIYDDYDEFVINKELSKRVNMIPRDCKDDYGTQSAIMQRSFADTIQENINSFYHILDLAYEWNPQMQIYVLLMPRYIQAEKQEKEQMVYTRWKEQFYSVILQAQEQYKFTFLDWKEHEISYCSNYYEDVSHFNYFGAMKFTEILNNYIFPEIIAENK